jgi:nucleotide-binding universal stress UspA family protein
MGKIVVGVDGSRPSKEALRWAAEQARLSGDELHVVSAWDFAIPQSLALSVPDTSDPIENQREGLAHLVTDVLGEEPRVDVHLEVIESRPIPALINLAKTADLLVVGCRGHGAISGLLLGSVSLHCATHASCPVVIVHHHSGNDD